MNASQDVHARGLPLLHPRQAASEVSAASQHIDEIRVDMDPARAAGDDDQITGRRTVPQIFIGDTHVGGCDDLSALDQPGGLMPLLGQVEPSSRAGSGTPPLDSIA